MLFIQIGTFGAVAAAVFVVALAVVAFIAFKMLAKTVKMAFRMVIVAVILVIALIGGAALLMFGSGTKNTPKPAATKPR